MRNIKTQVQKTINYLQIREEVIPRHELDASDTSAIRVKKLDFDTCTIENIFSHPYISYIANERFYGEQQFFTFGNALFTFQNTFEKCATKTELCNGKTYIKKLYTRL